MQPVRDYIKFAFPKLEIIFSVVENSTNNYTNHKSCTHNQYIKWNKNSKAHAKNKKCAIYIEPMWEKSRQIGYKWK